ncbi:MAG: hypothetical protein EZS28_042790, partial [Streblomastix strix]
CFWNVERDNACLCIACKHCKTGPIQFCWICAQPWFPSHKDHYTCNTPPEQRRTQLEMASATVDTDYDRFYYERVDEQKVSLNFAKLKLEEAPEMIGQYKKIHNCTDSHSEFIHDCAQTLVRCRQYLLHSYILGYSVPYCIAKNTFQIQQGFLQGNAEWLLVLQEKEAEELDRNEILNYSASCQKYLDNLIEFFANDAQELLMAKIEQSDNVEQTDMIEEKEQKDKSQKE